VSRGRLGRHTGRAQLRVEARVGVGKPRHRGRVGRSCRCRLQVRGARPRLARREKREIRSRDVVHSQGKPQRLDPGKRVGDPVDGILGHDARAVAALVRRFQREVGIELLRGLHAEPDVAALPVDAAACRIAVDHIRRVDERTTIGEQPDDAVGLGVRAGFFAGGQRQDQVAIRHEAITLQPRKDRGEDGAELLVVGRAAPVVIAVLLDERVRVRRPVSAQSRHDVQVGEKQHGFRDAAPAQPRDQIAARRPRPDDDDIVWREAGVQQELPNPFGGRRGAAVRLGRIDGDQLAE